MRKIAVLAILLATAPAWAETPQSRLLEVDKVKGMWFPMDKARELLKGAEELPGVRLQLQLIEQRLTLEKNRTGLLEKNVQTNAQIADIWKQTAQAQAAALATKNPWWKNPYLWLGVGFVVGTGATIGIAAAVRHSGVN